MAYQGRRSLRHLQQCGAITYADVANILLCVLPLDFKEAFDKISHTYLLTILQSRCYSDAFIERIKHMYNNATFVVQINGHFSGPVPIHCSVRQECPLSMTLFALCLNPVFHRLG